MQNVLTGFVPSQQAKFVFAKPNAEDLVFLKKLIEVGKIPMVIHCTYPFVELGRLMVVGRVGVLWGKLRRRSPL